MLLINLRPRSTSLLPADPGQQRVVRLQPEQAGATGSVSGRPPPSFPNRIPARGRVALPTSRLHHQITTTESSTTCMAVLR